MATGKKDEGKLKIGDRVIYWGLEKPLYGTVRWLGTIKNISDDLTAGVELDKRYGQNNGTWNNQTYFKCEEKHGLFIDANGLMLSADFGEEVAESDSENYDESNDENNDESESDDDNASSDDGNVYNEIPIENGDNNDNKTDVNELIRMLQYAIQKGFRQQSQEMAAKLAELRVKCEINLIQGGAKKKKKQQQAPPVIPKPKEELRLNVKVERKDGLEEAFSITVPDNFTLNQLKQQVETYYAYPAELQQWFFDNDLKKDGSQRINTLKYSEPILYIKEASVNPDLEPPFETVKAKSKGKNRTNKNSAKKPGQPKKESKKQRHYKTPQTTRENKVEEKAIDEEVGWKCKACTYLNDPPRPGCVICGCNRPEDYVVPPELQRQFDAQQKELELVFEANYIRELEENFSKYVELDDVQVVITNENFECKICYADVEPGQGIRLRDCLHTFCRECLKGTIQNSEDIPVRCPFQDDDYACESEVQQREIQQLLSPEDFQKYLDRECAKAAGQSQNAFHCRTPDCKGWCIYEDDVTEFQCDVCGKTSCISCQAIHEGEDCKQYQDRLKLEMANNESAKETQRAIEDVTWDYPVISIYNGVLKKGN